MQYLSAQNTNRQNLKNNLLPIAIIEPIFQEWLALNDFKNIDKKYAD